MNECRGVKTQLALQIPSAKCFPRVGFHWFYKVLAFPGFPGAPPEQARLGVGSGGHFEGHFGVHFGIILGIILVVV